MKTFASTLVLLLAAALLGGWWWWHERETPLPSGVRNVVRIDATQVEHISLQNNNNSNKALIFQQTSPDKWQISFAQNVRAVPADSDLVQQWLGRFATLNSDAVYADDINKRARFGLAKPKSRTTFSGTSTVKIEWGDRAPFAPPRIYARIETSGQSENRNQIALLPLDLWQQTQRPFEDWRDRRVLRFDANKVTKIVLHAPQIDAAFSRTQGNWRIESPLRETADMSNIAALLNALSAAQIVRWPKNVLSGTAQNKALAVVTLIGDGEQQLVFERRVSDGFLARRVNKQSGKPLSDEEPFIVSADVFAVFDKPLLAWRSKEVFNFAIDAAASVTVIARGQTVSYRREGAKWQKKSAAPNANDERGNAVWELLLPARDLRAPAFAAARDWPQSAPLLEIRLMEAGIERRLQIAKAGNRVLARSWRGAQQSPIWVLPPDTLARFDVALNALFSPRQTPTLLPRAGARS